MLFNLKQELPYVQNSPKSRWLIRTFGTLALHCTGYRQIESKADELYSTRVNSQLCI